MRSLPLRLVFFEGANGDATVYFCQQLGCPHALEADGLGRLIGILYAIQLVGIYELNAFCEKIRQVVFSRNVCQRNF